MNRILGIIATITFFTLIAFSVIGSILHKKGFVDATPNVVFYSKLIGILFFITLVATVIPLSAIYFQKRVALFFKGVELPNITNYFLKLTDTQILTYWLIFVALGIGISGAVYLFNISTK